MWFSNFLKNDSDFITSLKTRCLSVQLNCSMWLVCSLSLPTARCRLLGKTVSYACLGVHSLAPKSAAGSRRTDDRQSDKKPQSDRALSRLRSPVCTPIISRVSWLIANQIHCLLLLLPTLFPVVNFAVLDDMMWVTSRTCQHWVYHESEKIAAWP